jgi:hypothetical protein
MTSNENLVNIKVVDLMKIYNFYFGHLVIRLNLKSSNFEFKKITTSNQNLNPQIILTEKIINTKVVELMKIYNFYFGHLVI